MPVLEAGLLLGPGRARRSTVPVDVTTRAGVLIGSAISSPIVEIRMAVSSFRVTSPSFAVWLAGGGPDLRDLML